MPSVLLILCCSSAIAFVAAYVGPLCNYLCPAEGSDVVFLIQLQDKGQHVSPPPSLVLASA